jgi:hypothetical protein
MPARLDLVTVTTTRGPVSLSWASRGLLLDQIYHLDSATRIAKAFGDVGASRPVTLTEENRALLFELLDAWSSRVGVDGLPAGVWELRCAIADDLHDDPR